MGSRGYSGKSGGTYGDVEMTEQTVAVRGLAEPDVGYRQCTRCVMDTLGGLAASMTFDDDGVCNFCTAMIEEKSGHLYGGEYSDEMLDDLVRKLKEAGAKREYDAVVGISGGLDSSYLCYRLKELGIRMLAVHCDSGWNSELAVMNIERIVRKLDIDYQTYVIDWEEF